MAWGIEGVGNYGVPDVSGAKILRVRSEGKPISQADCMGDFPSVLHDSVRLPCS
jgi:hypothetical protein